MINPSIPPSNFPLPPKIQLTHVIALSPAVGGRAHRPVARLPVLHCDGVVQVGDYNLRLHRGKGPVQVAQADGVVLLGGVHPVLSVKTLQDECRRGTAVPGLPSIGPVCLHQGGHNSFCGSLKGELFQSSVWPFT